MADTKNQLPVDRADEGDLEATIIGLEGVLWALNMLVIHHAATDPH